MENLQCSLWDSLQAAWLNREDEAVYLAAEGQVICRFDDLKRRTAEIRRRLNLEAAQRVMLPVDGGLESLLVLLAVSLEAQAIPYDPSWPVPEREKLAQLTRAEVCLDDHFQIASRSDGHGGRSAGFLLSTSGSSGLPKLVPLTHKMLLASARNIAMALQLRPEDRQILAAPLHHVFGLLHWLSSLLSGGQVVVTRGFHSVHWLDWLEKSRPTWYAAPPAMHHGTLRRLDNRERPDHCLRLIRSSTAPLRVDVRDRLAQRLGVPVLEAYGMTETCSQIASQPLPPASPRERSVGHVCGPEVAILGPQGQFLAPGEAGEILVRGATVMAGYEGEGEQPFWHDWLRTGDQGWLDEDGFLYLDGRLLEWINRGGEKVWPAEVDRVLANHPCVLQALTFALPDERLGQEVMAAVVLREPVSERRLLQFAAEQLAPYKRPRRIFICAELPQDKTQRRQLAEQLQPQMQATPPLREDLLHWAIESFRKTLEVAEVDRNDSFFELGGDSLLATLLINRLQTELGQSISPVALFERDTPAALAAYLGEEHPSAPVPRSYDNLHEHPLSYAQERMWSLVQMLPEEPLDNSGRFLKIDGPLDPLALEQALGSIVQRHALLRTTFHPTDDGPVQRVHAAFPSPPLLRQADLRAFQDAATRAFALAEQEAARVFDLENEALLRVTLLRTGEQQWILLLMRHHLISDGWSIGLFLRELEAAYRATTSHQAPSLPSLPLQYYDFARWQRHKGHTAEADLAYWGERLGKFRATRLPETDPEGTGFAAHYHTFAISAELVEALRLRARYHRVTPYILLLTAFKAVVGALAGVEQVVIGSPNANRSQLEWEGLLGFFVNTMVLGSTIRPGSSLEELLQEVRATVTGALAHQHLPFEEMVKRLQPDGEEPFFRILFVLLNAPLYQPRWPGLQVHNWGPGPRTLRMDMETHLFPQPSGALEGWCVYNAARYSEPQMRALTDAYLRFLEAVVAGSPLPLPEPLPDVRARAVPAQVADALEVELLAMWRAKLGRHLSLDVPLVQLGGSSLVAVEMALEIEKRWGRRPSLARLLSCSVREQARQLSVQEPAPAALVLLKPGQGTPLFLVHPIGGGALVYQELAGQLDSRPVYAFQALDGPGSRSDRELPDLAAIYLTEMREIQSQGPYLLGGLSYGGTLAYEMAQQLGAQNVGFLGLIDTFRPGFRWQSSLAQQIWHQVQRTKMHLHGWLHQPLSYPARKWRARQQAIGIGAPSTLRPALDRYLARPYSGPVTLFRARYQPLPVQVSWDLGWSDLIQNLRVESVAGMHGTSLLELPLARGLARKLRNALHGW